MKKLWLIAVALVILMYCFSSCSSNENHEIADIKDQTGETTGKLEGETPKAETEKQTTETEKQTTETEKQPAETEKQPAESSTQNFETETKPIETETPTVKPIEVKPGFLPLLTEPTLFTFCSGRGAWSTGLKLNADGTFVGTFSDSNMGEVGDGYPNGTRYVCSFSGKFENIEKINDYSYKMTLAYLNTEKPSGQEWIENGVKIITSDAYGIEGGTNFVLYLPGAPTTEMSMEFLSWYISLHFEVPETLPSYGLMNVEKGYGFF